MMPGAHGDSIAYERALLYLEPAVRPAEAGVCLASVKGRLCGAQALYVRVGRPCTLQVAGRFLLDEKLDVPLCGRHERRHPRSIDAVVSVVCA